jgi:hypothetical protein
MINNALHKNPVPLDREKHRALHVDRQRMVTDLSPAAALNSFFVNAVEFADACREYPLVFVRAGQDDKGQPEFAPVAVFGLAQGENLFLEGKRWLADYLPAQLRAYPFAMARLDNQQYAVCIDHTWPGFSDTQGTALFEADGQPSAYLTEMQQYLEKLETEMRRTRAFCAKLHELDLLQSMRFDATLPDGEKLTVDGFLALDEKKVAALPDATVLELHKNGILALIHLHQASLGNMRRLLERRVKRKANA